MKKDPNNIDAIYVHHFHEKIPSRMLAPYTDCKALDVLIAARPSTPEFYRTRAMIHCFREEFPAALRDFKTAIALVKKRKRNVNGVDCEGLIHGGVQSKQAFHLDSDDDNCNESLLYFLRAACFHQYAISLIDKAIEKVNSTTPTSKRKKKNKKKKKSASTGDDPSVVSEPTPASTGTSRPPPTPTKSHPPTWKDYKAAMQPSANLIENLARRSTRDYHHFLSFYPNALEPFPHAGAEVSCDTPPPSPVLPNGVETMPAFVNSVSSKALTKMSATTVNSMTLSHHHSSCSLHHQHKELDKSRNPKPQEQSEPLPVLGTYHPLLVRRRYYHEPHMEELKIIFTVARSLVLHRNQLHANARLARHFTMARPHPATTRPSRRIPRLPTSP